MRRVGVPRTVPCTCSHPVLSPDPPPPSLHALAPRSPWAPQGRLAEWGGDGQGPPPAAAGAGSGRLALFPPVTSLIPPTFHQRFFALWFIFGLSAFLIAIILLIIFA